jgi:signal transduction histidine kinase
MAKRHDPLALSLLNTCRQSAQRLVAQVSSLLDIRRIEEGRMKLNLRTLPVGKMIRPVLQEYQPAAEKVGLRIHCDLGAAERLLVRVDEDLCARILGNLVWNAIKYAAPQSTIELAGRPELPTAVAITVSNHGAPIPPAQQQELFQPFSAFSRESRNVGVSASGIGLVFCKLAVEAMGGSIRLESPWQPPDDGVRVSFTLPAAAGS